MQVLHNFLGENDAKDRKFYQTAEISGDLFSVGDDVSVLYHHDGTSRMQTGYGRILSLFETSRRKFVAIRWYFQFEELRKESIAAMKLKHRDYELFR